MTSDHLYAAMADAQAEPELSADGGWMGLSDPAVASLRCYQRYHKDARLELRDGLGVMRWMTRKQARIHAVISRIAVTGERLTMTAIAQETQACPSTVSRALTKFQAWSMFGAIIWRGRHGGVVAYTRFLRDHGERFALAAQARVKAARDKVRARMVNLASTITREKEAASRGHRRDATFSPGEPLEAVGRPWTLAELPSEVGGTA